MSELGEHWDTVYETKAASELSWFERDPSTSLRLLRRWAPSASSVVDVGAGTSELIESVLDAGVGDTTLLDISTEALEKVRARLGERAAAVSFVVADIRRWQPGRTFDVWHDRAVFHFLVDTDDRQRYLELVAAAVAPGGVVVLATFAADGPSACSGLPTSRYDSGDLARLFSSDFTLEYSEREEHVTPWGAVQPFTWVVLRRAAS